MRQGQAGLIEQHTLSACKSHCSSVRQLQPILHKVLNEESTVQNQDAAVINEDVAIRTVETYLHLPPELLSF